MKNVRVSLLVRDPHARGRLFLFGGTAFHFLYGSFRLLMGVLYSAYRVDGAAFFYLSLALSRLFLLRSYRETREDTAYACRFCGRALFVTAGILLLWLAQTALSPHPAYPFYVLIVSGGYALTSVSLAIAELWYLRRLKSPLLSASRAVGLASTLLSAAFFLSDVVDSVSVLGDAIKTAVRLALCASALLFVLFLAVGLSQNKKSDA